MKQIIIGFGMLCVAILIFMYAFGVYDFNFVQNTLQSNRSSAVQPTTQSQDESIARLAIESEYPQFKNFEKQKTFFERKVDILIDGGNRYVAYMSFADTVQIGSATCFQVDIVGNVTQIGVFPDPSEAYGGFMSVYPKTCKGLR